jgi:hypothetical protein
MYRLYPIDGNLTTIKSFLIDYEWDMDGNNHEWRNCVSHFLELLQSYGSKVTPIDVPPFIGHEDFFSFSVRS